MRIHISILLAFIAMAAQAQMEFVAPVPGSTMHNPDRRIVIRPGNVLDTHSLVPSLFTVTGSVSGIHDFSMVLARDQKTINLNPKQPFAYGETVNVEMKPGIRQLNGDLYQGYSFSFSIHREYTPEELERFRNALKMEEEDFRSASVPQNEGQQLRSPTDYEILVNTNPTPGQVLFSNLGPDQKLWIIQNNGDSVYEQNSPSVGFDWKLNHDNYFTAHDSFGIDHFNLYDSNYLKIDSFTTVNDYKVGNHDFQIFPDGHYFMKGNDPEIVNMQVYDSSYQPDASVIGNVIQEFDTDKNLIFEWRTFDHIGILESLHENFANKTISPCHMNSIEQDFDGNIIVSFRELDQIDKIDLSTGDFIWRWGGTMNQFTFVNDTIKFNTQHDARRLPNGHITLFDNNNFGTDKVAYAKEYELDEVNKTATLVWSYAHPLVNGEVVESNAMGNVQRLDNGNTFIDWGLIIFDGGFPNMTEVDTNDNIVWELRYQNSEYMYRAHRNSWDPCSRPSDSKLKADSITSRSAILTWNAATGAIKYNIQYRPQGTITWTSILVGEKIYIDTLNNLLANTVYEWRIQSWCDESGIKQSNFTATKTFTTLLPTGVDDLNVTKEAVKIYPNPSSDKINIQWMQQQPGEMSADIQLLNLMGQTVMEKKLFSKEGTNASSIDIQSLPTGMYLIRLSTTDQYVELKWVKD